MTRMKIITIYLPEKYLEAIQTLQDLGLCPSRSAAVRTALGDFLDAELKTFNDLETNAFKKTIECGVKIVSGAIKN